MPRRLHVVDLRAGLLTLDPGQSHHARQVLRLGDGDEVEVFDDAGAIARGLIVAPAGSGVIAVRVEGVDAGPDEVDAGPALTVAAAVPKGERADWMVEKLSEIGCAAFVPLVADRSVVAPKGTGKHDRWVRLATESAKQCRRRGVMRVDAPTPLDALLAARPDADAGSPAGRPRPAWFLDTGPTAVPIRELLLNPEPPAELALLVGPEGGWTPREVDRMLDGRATAVALTRTILRVETAAVAAAACAAAMWAGRGPR